MNHAQKVDYSFFDTQEKMFFNNKTPSSCDYIVVNLCKWYQMKVFPHEFYVAWACLYSEAVVQRCSVQKLFLEIPQNSQENTCARVSFLIKLQGFFCIFRDFYQRYNHLLLNVYISIVIRKGKIVWKHGPYLVGFWY